MRGPLYESECGNLKGARTAISTNGAQAAEQEQLRDHAISGPRDRTDEGCDGRSAHNGVLACLPVSRRPRQPIQRLPPSFEGEGSLPPEHYIWGLPWGQATTASVVTRASTDGQPTHLAQRRGERPAVGPTGASESRGPDRPCGRAQCVHARRRQQEGSGAPQNAAGATARCTGQPQTPPSPDPQARSRSSSHCSLRGLPSATPPHARRGRHRKQIAAPDRHGG